MPLKMDEGWNQIQLNLADLTRRAYGTNYAETLRVQIHANCRLRRIYFADRLYSEEELPPEFKLYLPLQVWISQFSYYLFFFSVHFVYLQSMLFFLIAESMISSFRMLLPLSWYAGDLLLTISDRPRASKLGDSFSVACSIPWNLEFAIP